MQARLHYIDYEEVADFLDYLDQQTDFELELDTSRQLIIAQDQEHERVFTFRLPLPCPPLASLDELADYIIDFEPEPLPYLFMLVQAGSASIGYFEEGGVIKHKVIKKYMIRAKRGKAQITYLKSRGKSKAGSRIRLANTVRFFEEINQRLTDWMEYLEPERILYSCTATIWGAIHNSKTSPPFEKKDPRLIKVPHDVHQPDHEEMLRVNELCLRGQLSFYQEVELPGWEN